MVTENQIIEIIQQIPVSAKTRNLIFYLNEAIKEINKINKKSVKKTYKKNDFSNLNKTQYENYLRKIDKKIQEEKNSQIG